MKATIKTPINLPKLAFALIFCSAMNLGFANASAVQCGNLFTKVKEIPLGVGMDFIEKMQSRPQSATEKMLQRYTTANGLKVPMKTAPEHDNNYSNVLAQGTIKNQQQSGRCWIFAALTAIENFHLGKGDLMPDAEFSRTYIQFFNMLERSNSYLEKIVSLRQNARRIGNSTILENLDPKVADGGWVEDIVFLIKKYGLVTISAMPETLNSLNTATMLEEINGYLKVKSYEMWNLSERFDANERALHNRIVLGQLENSKKYDKVDLEKLTEDQMKHLQAKKDEILGGVWLILEKALGRPPKTFSTKVPVKDEKTGVVKTKIQKFDPRTFTSDYLKFNPEDWINVSNLRNRARDQVYQVKYQDMNRAIRRLNLDPLRMMNLVKAQILGGMPVAFDSKFGPGVNKNGDMQPGTDSNAGMFLWRKGQKPNSLSPSEMDLLGLLTANHETVFMGFDQPVGYVNPVKFKVQNSWSATAGVDGNFNLSAQWFDLYVDGIMIHKSFLTPEELAIYNGPAVILKAVGE